ncbi:hypothetical protein BDD12DRAFT_907812 [Trichophaea hybrida]|nr:hypothetical protein BDD12DRAFT_907812 [Trichophaea hybrida]
MFLASFSPPSSSPSTPTQPSLTTSSLYLGDTLSRLKFLFCYLDYRELNEPTQTKPVTAPMPFDSLAPELIMKNSDYLDDPSDWNSFLKTQRRIYVVLQPLFRGKYRQLTNFTSNGTWLSEEERAELDRQRQLIMACIHGWERFAQLPVIRHRAPV